MTGAAARRETGRLIGPAFKPRWSFSSLFGLTKPAFVEVEPVTAAELLAILAKAFQQEGFSSCAMRPGRDFDDERYYLPTPDDIRRLMQARSPTTGYGSVVDLFDCDDFAYNFRGFSAAHRFSSRDRQDATTPLAIGLLWGQGFDWIGQDKHVLNLTVLQDKTVWLIDSSLKKPVFKPLGRGVASELHYLVI